MTYGPPTLGRPYRQVGSIMVHPDYWDTAVKIKEYDPLKYDEYIDALKGDQAGWNMCGPHLPSPNDRCSRCRQGVYQE